MSNSGKTWLFSEVLLDKKAEPHAGRYLYVQQRLEMEFSFQETKLMKNKPQQELKT